MSEFLYTQVAAYRRDALRDTLNSEDGVTIEAGDSVEGTVRETNGRYVIGLTVCVDRNAIASPDHAPSDRPRQDPGSFGPVNAHDRRGPPPAPPRPAMDHLVTAFYRGSVSVMARRPEHGHSPASHALPHFCPPLHVSHGVAHHRQTRGDVALQRARAAAQRLGYPACEPISLRLCVDVTLAMAEGGNERGCDRKHEH